MTVEQHPFEIDVLGSRHHKLRIADNHISSVFERILEELLKDDVARFQATLEKALEPQKGYLTDTEYQLYRRGKKAAPHDADAVSTDDSW